MVFTIIWFLEPPKVGKIYPKTIVFTKNWTGSIVVMTVIFPVFQNVPEDPPLHRVRGDLGGPGPGPGDQQTDRHQQGHGGPQRLRV